MPRTTKPYVIRSMCVYHASLVFGFSLRAATTLARWPSFTGWELLVQTLTLCHQWCHQRTNPPTSPPPPCPTSRTNRAGQPTNLEGTCLSPESHVIDDLVLGSPSHFPRKTRSIDHHDPTHEACSPIRLIASGVLPHALERACRTSLRDISIRGAQILSYHTFLFFSSSSPHPLRLNLETKPAKTNQNFSIRRA